MVNVLDGVAHAVDDRVGAEIPGSAQFEGVVVAGGDGCPAAARRAHQIDAGLAVDFDARHPALGQILVHVVVDVVRVINRPHSSQDNGVPLHAGLDPQQRRNGVGAHVVRRIFLHHLRLHGDPAPISKNSMPANHVVYAQV